MENGPLFAIFLAGLVALWGTTGGIPLLFNKDGVGRDVTYPTAINILIGGPGQQVSITNSVSLPDTFALYIVAIFMLWVVMMLPFILLRIFLDYLNTLPIQDSFVKRVMNFQPPFLPKQPPPLVPSSPPPAQPPSPTIPPFRSTGMARSLPFENRSSVAQTSSQSVTNVNRQSTQVLKMANLSIPTMRDIARFETNTITNNREHIQETIRVQQVLEKIANPIATTTPAERVSYTNLREELTSEKQKGNPVATTILQAAQTAQAVKSTTSNAVAPAPSFPVVNRVQTVSLEDYEAVKKMWQENYTKLEAPADASGKPKDKEQWITEDIQKITEAVNLLLSHDQKQVKEGMKMVSDILPFLLVGGFSQTEVVAYLKAKLEAAKSTKSDFEKKKEEEDTMIETSEKKEEAHATMEEHRELPIDDEKPDQTHSE